MTRVLAQIRKELTQLRRDPLTLALALALPALLLLLLSTATSLSVRDIPIVVQDLDRTPLSRRYVERVGASLAFRVNMLPDGIAADRALDGNLARAAIIIPPQFDRKVARGDPAEVQWLIDATDSNTANVMRGKIAAITEAFNHDLHVTACGSAIQPQLRYWFNPGREDLKYFGPGVLAFGMAIFPTILTALAFSREGELKTILQVYVSNVSAFEYLLGKVIAYTFVALVEWTIGMGILFSVFGLRLAGEPTTLLTATLFYLLCSTCWGAMVGAGIPNQAAAIQAAQLGSLLTSFLFAGYLFPVQNIPQPLRFLSTFVPMRYYLDVLRDAFLRGGGWPRLWHVPIALTLLASFFFWRAWSSLRDMQLKA
jgi:ABC-2 type transport system permease protein